MKKYLIFVLFILPFRTYSQNLPNDFELLIPEMVNNDVDTPIFEYKKIDSGIFNDYKRPFILFYTFSGCRGCQQVMNLVLKPTYQTWKDEFGLDIYCIIKYYPEDLNAIAKKILQYTFSDIFGSQ